MNILAMDTSSSNATVAVANECKILGEYTVSSQRDHSRIIMPMLESLLEKCSLEINDIDVFAVALGPGSFTGLRIGIATMKTLAGALAKKIIGVSSLDIVSANFFDEDYYVCPMFDARRNDVYNAIYKDNKKIVSDRIADFDDILIEMKDKKTIFAGDALIKYKEKILSFSNPKWKIAPLHMQQQNAQSLISLAIQRIENNDFDNVSNLLPIYIRPSQAEREYMEKHGVNSI